LESFNETFDPNYNAKYDLNQLQYVKTYKYEIKKKFFFYSNFRCNDSGKINITLNIITDDNNITGLNEVFERLKNASSKNADLFSVNECGNNGIGK